MMDIAKLTQNSTIDKYVSTFNTLYDRIDVPDSYGTTLFLAGLKPDLSSFTQLLNPLSFEHAVQLALSAEIALPLF